MKQRFRWEKLDRSCDLCPSHLSWGHRGQCLHRHWDTQPKLPAGHLPTTEKGFVKVSNINAHTDIGTDIDNIRRREREEESAAYAPHPSCLFSTCVSTDTSPTHFPVCNKHLVTAPSNDGYMQNLEYWEEKIKKKREGDITACLKPQRYS